MTLQIPIPEGFEETLRRNIGGDLAVYVREAVAVDLYRNRRLTHGQLQKFLGVSSYEADTVLKNHGGVDEVTPEELAASRNVTADPWEAVISMLVVSDNSPLQYLVLIGCVDVLPKVYGVVLTTLQVLDELLQPQTPEVVRIWASSPPQWLKVESPSRIDFIDRLDIGEASAISLARERGANLILIDELAGSDTAREMGIASIGTLGVLIEAGLEQLIDFDDVLTRLITETSFYATPRLVETARRIYRERK